VYKYGMGRYFHVETMLPNGTWIDESFEDTQTPKKKPAKRVSKAKKTVTRKIVKKKAEKEKTAYDRLMGEDEY